MTQWVLNPQARYALTVHTPLRQRGLQQVQISCQPGDGLIQLLARIEHNPNLADYSPQEIEQLKALGLLAPEDQLSESVFYAPLLSLSAQMPEPLGVPEDLYWNVLPTVPEQAQALLAWMEYPHCLWTKALCFEVPLPVLCTVADFEHLQTLRQQIPQQLSLIQRARLYQSGVLASKRHVQAQQALRQRVNTHTHTLTTKGYFVLRQVIHPFQLRALVNFVDQLWQEGYFETSSTQVALRDVLYNHPLMSYIHHCLAPWVSQISGETLKPSYSIVARYHSHAELSPHTDRPQCRWNVSLVLGARPTQRREQAWPLYIEHMQRIHEIRLQAGDLVMYKGQETPHWRTALPAGQEVTVGLFHFVAAEFSGSLA